MFSEHWKADKSTRASAPAESIADLIGLIPELFLFGIPSFSNPLDPYGPTQVEVLIILMQKSDQTMASQYRRIAFCNDPLNIGATIWAGEPGRRCSTLFGSERKKMAAGLMESQDHLPRQRGDTLSIWQFNNLWVAHKPSSQVLISIYLF
jgi:hypothetical protein